MQNNELSKIIGYDKDFAYEQILKAFSVVLKLNKNDKRIEDILLLTECMDPFPVVLRKIDTKIGSKINLEMQYKKSHHDLQGHTIASIYYAIFIVFDLSKNNYQNYSKNKNVINICKIALKYHYSYLVYKSEEQKNKELEQGNEFYEKCAIVIIRTIEILGYFALQENSLYLNYLNKVYFQVKNDLDINFYNIISDDSEYESTYFKIKTDPKVGNYIAYSNYNEGIEIQVESSRKIKKGSDSKNDENNNIIKFLLDDFKYYFKLINNEFREDTYNKSGGYRVKQSKLQETEEDELLNSTWLENRVGNMNLPKEDLLDAHNKVKKYHRNYTNEAESTHIPNLYKQRQRNKAFSSRITKRALLLPSNYEIPSIDVMKLFLLKQISRNIGKDNQIFFYDGVFLLDLLLGIGYKKIIDLLTKKKDIKLNTRNRTLTLKIDKKLFGLNSNKTLLCENQDKIVYTIPSRLVLLIEKLKIELQSSDTIKIDDLEKEIEADRYFTYMKDKIKSFDKTIHFDVKHMWRLVSSYIRIKKKEDMSSMFCIGRYQQNDTPRLAYTSTPKESQIHSKYIEEMYLLLDYHSILESFLELEENVYRQYFEFDIKEVFSGSKLAVKKDVAISFFTEIKKLIASKNTVLDDSLFNLASIYTRYALSLLLGTRGYGMSASLERCSFLTSTLIITEKGTTLLNGLRIIPLCQKAKQIIKNYQTLCSRYDITADNVYLCVNNKFEIFKQNTAYEICQNKNLSKNIASFVRSVPLNTGRHIIAQQAIKQNFNLHYLEALMGHYISGGEQNGIYSTLNMAEYIKKTQVFLEEISIEYKI